VNCRLEAAITVLRAAMSWRRGIRNPACIVGGAMYKGGLNFILLVVIICLAVVGVAGCFGTGPAGGLKKTADSEAVAAKKPDGQPIIKQPSEQDLSLLPPDIRRIKEKGRVVVAMYWQDRPPFFYNDQQGQLTGIDVGLARDIARWLGVEVVFDRQSRSFDEVVDRVASGRADLGISKLSVTLSRAQRVRYTQPYVVFHQALLVNRLDLAAMEARQPGSDPLGLIINSAPRIGVRRNTSYVEYAGIMFPNAQIVEFPELEELIGAVQEGKVPAAFYDEFELKTQIHKNPKLSIYAKLFIIKDSVDPIAMAVAPADGQLLAWLNTYLEVRKKDLLIDRELERYSGGLNAAN